jgi:hypothetical protein
LIVSRIRRIIPTTERNSRSFFLELFELSSLSRLFYFI